MGARPNAGDGSPPTKADPVLAWFERRHTVRVYENRPVPPELVERVLRAAVLAPSAHNRQPWRFVVVTSQQVQRRLAEAMAQEWERDLAADGVDPAVAEAWLGFSRRRFGEAPVLIVACLTMVEMDRYPDERRQRAEYVMGVQSVAAAIENLLLAAAQLGLGAAWTCAPLFAPDVVRRVLELPADWEPQAAITLGYPRHERRYRDRKPLDAVMRWIR